MTPNTALPPRGTALLLLALVPRAAALPSGRRAPRRSGRAALRARRRRDAPARRLGGADAAGPGRGSRSRRSTTGWPGAAFSVLGETETAARLPSVLAAVALTGITALVGARLYGAAAGLHAGFVAGTCLLTFAYGRAAAMDMLLAATVSAAIGLFGLRLLGIAGPMAVIAAGACAGLALLAKGPLGALLPSLVALAYLAAARDRADGLAARRGPCAARDRGHGRGRRPLVRRDPRRAGPRVRGRLPARTTTSRGSRRPSTAIRAPSSITCPSCWAGSSCGPA